MLEMLFTICLVTAPDRCERRHLTYHAPPIPFACLVGVQPRLAHWNEANP